jgi:hypothetical protein
MTEPTRPSLWRRIVAALDDALPMPPDQRARRDRLDESSQAESERRILRFRIGLHEKRGTGGYR